MHPVSTCSLVLRSEGQHQTVSSRWASGAERLRRLKAACRAWACRTTAVPRDLTLAGDGSPSGAWPVRAPVSDGFRLSRRFADDPFRVFGTGLSRPQSCRSRPDGELKPCDGSALKNTRSMRCDFIADEQTRCSVIPAAADSPRPSRSRCTWVGPSHPPVFVAGCPCTRAGSACSPSGSAPTPRAASAGGS